MDTPEEERSLFDHVTCNISASVDEVSIPGALALDLIEQVLRDGMHFKIHLCIYNCLLVIVISLLSPRLKWKLKDLIS